MATNNHLPLPDLSYLRSRLRLGPRGELFWKRRPKDQITTAVSWNKRFAGRRAGAVKYGTYRMVRIDGVAYQEHRVAFALKHGRDPGAFQIDHYPKGLREATHKQNVRHRTKLSSNNTSGVLGVYWNKRCQKWMAEIKVDGQKIYLGVFADLALAASVRRTAEVRYFGVFAPTYRGAK